MESETVTCTISVCLCALNEKDAILKERLFGLTNPEGNHGEDVKGVLLLSRCGP